jgi:PncC family amidohydrolase
VVNAEVLAKVETLARRCALKGVSVGTAESCTGGLLSSWICSYPGASKFFNGGVVSYSRKVKSTILRVPLTLMQTHGEVSLPVAKAMASGAREALGCSWSVAITGVAGPSGGSKEKPVGTVCFSVVGPGFESSCQKNFPADADRQEIQRQAALFALDFLLNEI